jgi:hypothetical protein
MPQFYLPIWHGLSLANFTLIAIAIADIAWIIYWRFLTRRFDPPAIKWRPVPRLSGPTVPLNADESQAWRDSWRVTP